MMNSRNLVASMTDDVARVSERLRRYSAGLRKRDELGSFIDILNDQGEAYLFGGAARDVAFGAPKAVHDLDIFVSGNIDIERIARFSVIRRNRFGGFRLYISKMDVDAWELQKSYPFVNRISPYVSVFNLLQSVCFSTDGIAVSLRSGKTSRTGEFNNSLKLRRLDFVTTPTLRDVTVAARIARLVLKLDLLPSNEVATYFLDCVAKYGAGGILNAEGRWGNHMILNTILLEQIRSEFVEFRSSM